MTFFFGISDEPCSVTKSKCLPEVYIFFAEDACISGQTHTHTDKHTPVGRPESLPSEEASVTQRKGEGYKLAAPQSQQRRDQLDPPAHFSRPPLKPSSGGNTGRGWWIIWNFNPLRAIIQNKTDCSCLFPACTLVLGTPDPCFHPHTPDTLFPSSLRS